MAGELLGDDFKLFWDNASGGTGNYDTPTWEEQQSVGDLGFDPGNEQVEIPKRIAFKTYKKGRADWSLTFASNFDPENAFHLAVLDAITNGTKIHLAIAAGDIDEGAAHWHAWFMLSGPLDAALDTNANFEVEGKAHHDLGDGTEVPEFVPEGT